jgi:hypothetical protein
VVPTTTHLVVGAALLATSLVITLRSARLVAFRRPVAHQVAVRGRALA